LNIGAVNCPALRGTCKIKIRLYLIRFFIHIVIICLSLSVKAAAAALECQVCQNALAIELTKKNDNAIDFAANAADSCAGATNDDAQKVLCIQNLVEKAQQLFKDELAGVPAKTSCLNIGAVNC
jgi:hypothetical protein